MSSNGSDATWLSLLGGKKHDIDKILGQGYPATADVNSDRSFRTALETLCKKRGEHKPSRLEAKLFPSYGYITELAEAVDSSAADLKQLAPTDALEGLVWRISFAVIECGFKARDQLSSLVTLIVKLNNMVPHLQSQFPNEKRVQKPLQEIYTLFIEAHLFVIDEHAKGNLTLNVDLSEEKTLQTHISDTAKRIAEARGRYGVMRSQAAEDAERERMHLEQPSLEAKRNLPDDIHPDSTSNRELQVRFVLEKSLGHGSYGDVDEVRELTTGASYARKHIHLDADKPSDVVANEVKNEVLIMQKLRHLHIATVLFHFKEEDAYSIIMLPVADYDLRKFLSLCTQKDYSPALTKQIYPWFGCLLDALAYAHKLEIKHQDIKPSNILIKNNQPYLCDFGLAKDFAETNTSTSGSHNVKGTFMYRAPEVVPGRDRGRKADVFALGCVYSEMFTVTQEKSAEEYRDARQKAGSTAFRDCLPAVKEWLSSLINDTKGLNALLVDQILGMIDENDYKRLTAQQAVNFLKPEPGLFCVE
ncbi:hypothetical protein MMC22_011207 [Lobaria immixta]|nr:hypothetical protein [Lobaria immixta]